MLLLLLSCSLGNYKQVGCEQSSECLQAFGMGSTCGSDGFCEDITPHERCTKTIPSDLFTSWDQHRDDLIIGMLFDFSTDEANIAAVEMAINDANEEGGLNGRFYGLIGCDYQSPNATFPYTESPDSPIIEVSQYLSTTLSLPVIVGPAGSSYSLQAYPVTEILPSILISPSASSPELTSVDANHQKTDEDPGLFWRTVGSDEIQAATMAWQIKENNDSSIAFIYQNGSYGINFVSELLQNLPTPLTTASNSYEFTNRDQLTQLLTDAIDSNRTGIVFISADILDITAFMTLITTLVDEDDTGIYSNLHIYLADAAADEKLLALDINNQLSTQVYGTRPALPTGNVFDLFRDNYNTTTGIQAEQNVYAAYSFDATWLAIYGYAWAAAAEDPYNGTKIASGLRQLSDPTGPAIDLGIQWSTGRSYISSGQSIDITGASGNLDFDPQSEELFNPIEIFRLGQDNTEQCFYVTYRCTIQTEASAINCSPAPLDNSCSPLE